MAEGAGILWKCSTKFRFMLRDAPHNCDILALLKAGGGKHAETIQDHRREIS
jgi:hypothetical protein